jgi:hypothetical protein
MEKFAAFMILVLAFVQFVLSGIAVAAAVNPWTPSQNPGTCAGIAVGLFGAAFCCLAIFITEKLKK